MGTKYKLFYLEKIDLSIFLYGRYFILFFCILLIIIITQVY